VGRRYKGVGSDLGRIYEAHHVETGASALVLTPGRGDAWRPGEEWTVRVSGGVSPPFLVVAVEHAPRAGASSLPELTLMLHRLAEALARVEDRQDVQGHLTGTAAREAKGHVAQRPRRLRLGLGLLAATALTVLLWPLATTRRQGEEPASAKVEASAEPTREYASTRDVLGSQPLAYPMPIKPDPKQQKPPCKPELDEVEIRGGCWVELARRSPCQDYAAEYEGKCYLPVRAKAPEPKSLER
jgi:hypothetical protein